MLDTFVDKIFENLAELLPLVVVKSYERGVRWTMGRNPVALEPGFRLRVWLYHSIEKRSVVDDVLELPTQSVMTKDEKLLCFSAVIGFRIDDIVAHHCNVTEFTESTIAMAMAHLAKRVREQTLSEVVLDLTKLERSLKETLTTRFREWGTTVTFVGFPNFAEVPTQIRIFGEAQPFVKTA